jgi:hypothetical protein
VTQAYPYTSPERSTAVGSVAFPLPPNRASLKTTTVPAAACVRSARDTYRSARPLPSVTATASGGILRCAAPAVTRRKAVRSSDGRGRKLARMQIVIVSVGSTAEPLRPSTIASIYAIGPTVTTLGARIGAKLRCGVVGVWFHPRNDHLPGAYGATGGRHGRQPLFRSHLTFLSCERFTPQRHSPTVAESPISEISYPSDNQ